MSPWRAACQSGPIQLAACEHEFHTGRKQASCPSHLTRVSQKDDAGSLGAAHARAMRRHQCCRPPWAWAAPWRGLSHCKLAPASDSHVPHRQCGPSRSLPKGMPLVHQSITMTLLAKLAFLFPERLLGRETGRTLLFLREHGARFRPRHAAKPGRTPIHRSDRCTLRAAPARQGVVCTP